MKLKLSYMEDGEHRGRKGPRLKNSLRFGSESKSFRLYNEVSPDIADSVWGRRNITPGEIEDPEIRVNFLSREGGTTEGDITLTIEEAKELGKALVKSAEWWEEDVRKLPSDVKKEGA